MKQEWNTTVCHVSFQREGRGLGTFLESLWTWGIYLLRRTLTNSTSPTSSTSSTIPSPLYSPPPTTTCNAQCMYVECSSLQKKWEYIRRIKKWIPAQNLAILAHWLKVSNLVISNFHSLDLSCRTQFLKFSDISHVWPNTCIGTVTKFRNWDT